MLPQWISNNTQVKGKCSNKKWPKNNSNQRIWQLKGKRNNLISAVALASFVDVSLPSHFLHSLFPNLTINSQFFVSKIHGKLHRYLHKMLFITAGCRIRKKILINNTKFFMQTLTIDIKYHTVVMQLNEMQFSICSTNYEIQMLS